MEKIDHTIIGGGVVGLLLARELALKFPEQSIVIVEKNHFLGEESTSRNSGVLHAGLYYPFNSLKRKMCVQGRELWNDLATDLDVTLNNCGKWLVSSSASSDEDLKALFAKAAENEVPRIRWANSKEIEKLKKWVRVSSAFWSPNTAVMSPSEVVRALDRVLTGLDVIMLQDCQLNAIEKRGDEFLLKTSMDEFNTGKLYNCAGGFAPKVRSFLGLTDITSFWVKGAYLKLSGSFYNESLIYPVPPKNLKGLGVHTSFDLDGMIRFGPNTMDTIDYEMSLPNDLVEQMYPAINELFPSIEKEKLQLDYCGIRSKIKKDGELYTDFWIKSPLPNYVEALGIESPGFTSSPAIARELFTLATQPT